MLLQHFYISPPPLSLPPTCRAAKVWEGACVCDRLSFRWRKKQSTSNKSDSSQVAKYLIIVFTWKLDRCCLNVSLVGQLKVCHRPFQPMFWVPFSFPRCGFNTDFQTNTKTVVTLVCSAFEELPWLRWKKSRKRHRDNNVLSPVQSRLVAVIHPHFSLPLCASDYYWHTRCEGVSLNTPPSAATTSPLTGVSTSWAAALPDPSVSLLEWKQEPDWWSLEELTGGGGGGGGGVICLGGRAQTAHTCTMHTLTHTI